MPIPNDLDHPRHKLCNLLQAIHEIRPKDEKESGSGLLVMPSGDWKQGWSGVNDFLNIYMDDRMQEVLPMDCCILSHSFRKAGASSAFAVGAKTDRGIKIWGLWAVAASIETYVDREYPVCLGFAVYECVYLMFDWLVKM